MPDAKGRLGELDRITAPDLWPAIQGRKPRWQEPEQRYGRRALAAGVALLVTAAGMAFVARALLTSKPSLMVPPITPKSNGQIVFGCGELPFNSDLCVMENDHSPATRLVTDVGQALNPDWSPDGSRIALQVGGGADSGDASIFLMNADGSGLHEVISENDGNFDLDPDWSPDGTRIAFTRTPPGGVRGIDDDLFVADVDGLGVRKVFDSQTEAFDPRWSPDGTRLAFTQWDVPEGGRFDVFLLDLRDGRVARVTRSGSAAQAEWAPDGASLAFVQGSRIKQIRPDGTGDRTLYECRCAGISGLAWAPDGSAILFGATVHQGDQPAVQLFEMNADGTGVRQITFGSDSVCCPAWQPLPIEPTVETSSLPSPSAPSETPPPSPGALPPTPGAEFVGDIAYERLDGNSSSIWVMRPDGSGQHQLVRGSDPAWSPDGSRIAFRTALVEGMADIAVVDSDGSDQRILVAGVPVVGVIGSGGAPAWSSDGTKIAYASADGLFVVDAAGGTAQALATSPDCVPYDPAWSPDGSRIVFVAGCTERTFEEKSGIVTVNSDGSGQQRIVGPAGFSAFPPSNPSWSLDGAHLVFDIETEAGGTIYLANADGSNVIDFAKGMMPAWSPDGARIAFSDDGDIFVIGIDGTDQTQLTSTNDVDWNSAWQPISGTP